MSEPATTLPLRYRFDFNDGRSVTFDVALDAATLVRADPPPPAPPAWTALGYERCALCPLDPARATCPAALSMAQVAQSFCDCLSYVEVHVTVTVAERSYAKATIVQDGLGALIGVLMATSGCPVLAAFKPSARLHLPFASFEETVLRMSSMYLLAQHMRARRGLAPDWSLEGLKKIYEDVSSVNHDFSIRLRAAAARDANLNAIVNLDCFASMFSLALDESLDEMQGYFDAFLSG